jgi:hypothetical protein
MSSNRMVMGWYGTFVKSPGWMKRLEVSTLQILVFLPPKHLSFLNCQWILLNGEVQGQ